VFDFVDDENLELIADDTTITDYGDDVKEAIANMDNDVNKLLSWSNHNCLSINWSKTFAMFITDKKKTNFPSTILLNSKLINCVNSFKL
jgi:hypothetical protein